MSKRISHYYCCGHGKEQTLCMSYLYRSSHSLASNTLKCWVVIRRAAFQISKAEALTKACTSFKSWVTLTPGPVPKDVFTECEWFILISFVSIVMLLTHAIQWVPLKFSALTIRVLSRNTSLYHMLWASYQVSIWNNALKPTMTLPQSYMHMGGIWT